MYFFALLFSFWFTLFTVVYLNAINFLSLFILYSDWLKYMYIVYLQTIRSKRIDFFVLSGNWYLVLHMSVRVCVCVFVILFCFWRFCSWPHAHHVFIFFFRDFLSQSSPKIHVYHLLCCRCSMFHSVWSVHCILKAQNRYRSFYYLLLPRKLPDSAMAKQANIRALWAYE